GHAGDPPLAGGQRVGAGADELARTGASRNELVVGALGERQRPAGAGDREPVAQRLASLGLAVRATQGGAEVDEGAGVLEPCLRALEHRGRLAKRLESLAAPGD